VIRRCYNNDHRCPAILLLVKHISILLALLIALTFLQGNPCLGQSQNTTQNACPDEVDTNGKYVNEYGFSLVVPVGLKGTWNSARCVSGPDGCVCMSDHGRIIPLSNGQNDNDHWIEVYAGFSADMDEPTLQGEADKRVDWIRERSIAESVSVLERKDIKIGGIDAKRVVVRYRDRESSRVMVEDFVEALRGREGQIEYSLYLRSPADAYAGDKPNFERVLSTFALTPCDDCR